MNQLKKCTLVLNFSCVTRVNCVIKSTDILVLLFYEFTCGNFFFLIFYLVFCVLAVKICKNMTISFTIFCPVFNNSRIMEQVICEVWSGIMDTLHICGTDILNLSCVIFIAARNFMQILRIQQNRDNWPNLLWFVYILGICIYFMNLLTLFPLEIYRL